MVATVDSIIEKTVEKFREIEVKISREYGDFNLFALIEREDTPDKWDVVVSAAWIGTKYRWAIELIATEIKNQLSLSERLMVSRIVALPPTDPLVRGLNLVGAKHSSIRLTNNSFNGLTIKEAFLITSQASTQQENIKN